LKLANQQFAGMECHHESIKSQIECTHYFQQQRKSNLKDAARQLSRQFCDSQLFPSSFIAKT